MEILAQAFGKIHPEKVAAILERHPIEDVCEYISELNAKTSAEILSHLMPQYSGRLLTLLEASLLKEVADEMDSSLLSLILRGLPDKKVELIFENLSEEKLKDCKSLLHFPSYMVGAWMKTSIIYLPSKISVDEALMRLKNTPRHYENQDVYVVDRNLCPLGIVSLLELLQSEPNSKLQDLPFLDVESISSRLSIWAAEENVNWKKKEYLPVVNVNRQLLGEISRQELRTALDEYAGKVFEENYSSDSVDIFQMYGSSVRSLLSTLGGIFRPGEAK